MLIRASSKVQSVRIKRYPWPDVGLVVLLSAYKLFCRSKWNTKTVYRY